MSLHETRLRQARWAGWASLVGNIVIVVTGGAVRLTGSGLGCPTWPRCTEENFTPHGALNLHSAIEFGNRLLTFVLVAIAVATFLAAWRTGRRDLRRLLVVDVRIERARSIGDRRDGDNAARREQKRLRRIDSHNSLLPP